MKVFYLFSLMFISLISGYKPESKIVVYFFLGDECKISQYYTLEMKKLHEIYQGKSIKFIGVFPNPSSTRSKIEGFRKKYQIPFELHHDPFQKLMDKYKVTVTPEVIVLDELTDEVLYQGRIDNNFVSIGKRRSVPTSFELKEVLEAINKEGVIPYQRTEAVGCFITHLDPSRKNVPMCTDTDHDKN